MKLSKKVFEYVCKFTVHITSMQGINTLIVFENLNEFLLSFYVEKGMSLSFNMVLKHAQFYIHVYNDSNTENSIFRRSIDF